MRTYGRRERCVLKRESKKKPYRSAWSNAMWSYREMLRETPQTFWLMVGCVGEDSEEHLKQLNRL